MAVSDSVQDEGLVRVIGTGALGLSVNRVSKYRCRPKLRGDEARNWRQSHQVDVVAVPPHDVGCPGVDWQAEQALACRREECQTRPMYALFENLSERFEVQRNRLNQVIEVFEIGVDYAGSCLFECFKNSRLFRHHHIIINTTAKARTPITLYSLIFWIHIR